MQEQGYAVSGAVVHNSEATATIKVFLCYRRVDGQAAADCLFDLLNQYQFTDRNGRRCKLALYFDVAAPGVSNWRAFHGPSLRESEALILVATPAAHVDRSRLGKPDFVYRELRWWIDNRGSPIVVCPAGIGSEWLPPMISQRWRNLNRLELDVALAEDPSSGHLERLRARIVETILGNELAITQRILERERASKRRRGAAVVGIGMALAVASLAALYARDQADRAQQQAAVSSEVTSFLTRLFRAADPDQTLGDMPTVTDLLESGAQQLKDPASRLNRDPAIGARVRRAIGSAYTGIGLSEQALPLLEEAEKLANKAEFYDDEEQFRLSLALGEAYLYLMDYDKATPLLTKAVDLAAALHAEPDESRSTALIALGDLQVSSPDGDLTVAKQQYEAALAIDEARARGGEMVAQLDVARDKHRLGQLAFDTSDFSKALDLFGQAIESAAGTTAPLLVAKILNDQSAAHYQLGELDALETDLREARRIYAEVYGDDHPYVADVSNNLGRTLIEQGRIQEARTLLQEAVRIQEQSLGQEHPALIFSLNNLGLVLLLEGDLLQARALLERAIRITPQDDELAPAVQAQAIAHIAESYLKEGAWLTAGQWLDRAETAFVELELEENWRYGIALGARAEQQIQQCRIDSATDLLARSQELLRRSWPEKNPFLTELQRRANLIEDATSKCQELPLG